MLGQGIVPVILGKMAQLEYFGPLAAPPQVLFSNFCLKFPFALWFAELDSCHCMTAPPSHPAGAFTEGKLIQTRMLQGASQACVTLGHSQPHSQ